jgi:hypothetical protein
VRPRLKSRTTDQNLYSGFSIVMDMAALVSSVSIV